MKKCGSCKEVKPLDGFHVKRADPSGRQPWCKECNKRQVNAARKGQRDPLKPWPEKWIGYRAAHDRVKYIRGSASTHDCVDCGSTARDWAYMGGDPNQMQEIIRGSRLAYSGDPWYYQARCKPCHRKFDAAHRMVVIG